MKIQLPNGKKIILDDNIELKDKILKVNKLIEEWEQVCYDNWFSNSVKFFLDSLVNYLIWHKEEEDKGKEDKEVLSRTKLEQMNKFKKRSKSINFTDLSVEQKDILGIGD